MSDWNEFPNLQLIGERFYNRIKDDMIIKAKENGLENFKESCFEILGVFQQTWPNRAGLFEFGGYSGQSVTTYYTTVMYEHLTGFYGIFQENELVYVVEGTSENLLNDINNHTIKSLRNIKYYLNEEDKLNG